jgi:hypothetical protein
VRDAPLSASVSLSIIVAAFRALIIMDKGVSRLSEKQDGLINKTAGYFHGWNGRVFLRTSDVYLELTRHREPMRFFHGHDTYIGMRV